MLALWKLNITLWVSLFAVTAGARIGSSTPDLSQDKHQYASRQAFYHRILKKAEIVGNNGSPTSKFPLAECQGECDSDGK